MTWGCEDEVLVAWKAGGTPVTMTYDGDLKRRKRAEGSGWTTYLWDREQVLMELNKTGTTTVRYTQAPRGYGDVISQRRSSASTYWHFDAIGSMRFLTAADQSKAINYVYDAFGITRSVSGTTTNRFRYIGKLGYYLEPALGCYYLRRRYYVHWLGRFLSKDPLHQGGENAYGYVNNRPTRGTDPSGLVSVIGGIGIGGGIGTGVPGQGGGGSVQVLKVTDSLGNAGVCVSVTVAPLAAGGLAGIDIFGGGGAPNIPDLEGYAWELVFRAGQGGIGGVDASYAWSCGGVSVLGAGGLGVGSGFLVMFGVSWTKCWWVPNLTPVDQFIFWLLPFWPWLKQQVAQGGAPSSHDPRPPTSLGPYAPAGFDPSDPQWH